MWWLYQAALGAALLAVAPWLLARRGRHYLPTLRGRRVRDAAAPPGAPGTLWIHAVSVGEAAVASALAHRLPSDLPLLVTTITPTGQARARSGVAALAPRATVAYLPFDLGPPVERFLSRYAPAALVLVEGDYWPLLLARVRRRGLPVAVINGRLSDRSFPRLLRIRPLVRKLLLDPVDRFGVQTETDRERLEALGVGADRISVTGNLKFDFPEPPELPELAARMKQWADGRPLLVAGSTMPGEEEAVLAAFALAGGPERALLVVAPRHPDRFGDAWELARGRFPGSLRRSAGGGNRPAVVLLDSIGELAALYRYAAAAFVGGTLAPTGGHNPIEPARFGVPVAVGPSMENFREIAERFDAAAAWSRVRDSADLGALWLRLLGAPEEARALGARGRELVDAGRGATERTLELLAPLVGAVRDRRRAGGSAT
ncbi:MAG: 3-deoxy-D-manno-octulosonic acid transferase [Thermoanaerobaculia bacterium]